MIKSNARNLLCQFDFKGLFLNELGWDDHNGSLPFKMGEDTVILTALAEKRGMAAYLCIMPATGKAYDYNIRCRIEVQLAKSIREHLIIYIDTNRRFQTWQWVKREPGRPIARREHTYEIGQSGEALIQKLEALEFRIEEEGEVNLLGVIERTRRAFDVDRVTKRFYERFKTEHAAFLKQIDGVDEDDDREWYASIMLNRLKFVYFIQKKGFLDRDKDYLRNRLTMVQTLRGKDQFHSFYRTFLIKLFHEGLGRQERNPELHHLLGTVPYLNGGIFSVHPLEEKYVDIDISDKAFEKIFAFFDQYRWHLDERPLRADDEINPDVLGYIFEKYINQKQMGAYYTKEDITEYIAKNCIVPFILDRVEMELKKEGNDARFRSMFRLLGADPDRYIYDPWKHGVELPLPPEIERGLDNQKQNLLARRSEWNRLAPSDYALPTETWREVVTRRQQYDEIKMKIENLQSDLSTNDLVTLNLNLRQFAQDSIENVDTPDVLWAFWKAIEEITVLDPTCGSGAFLFAAVNVLEPLYEACLDRMKAFMLEWSQISKVPYPNFYKDFASVIAYVEKHPNEKYFIFKSIIIRNLYGVDIMDEAVEICKLRLFLKLAAQIEPNYDEDNLGIEPLPDIDFNIRSGNTLVGFATEKQAEVEICKDLLAFDTVWPQVQRDAKEIAELFSLFRLQQTEIDGAVSTLNKARLRTKLAPLEDRLNAYMANNYGISKKNGIKEWVHSHKPFHWFIEFYEIMATGGFDVIIGNPPYVEYTKIRKHYTIKNYTTEPCANLYAFVTERSLQLLGTYGSFGFIVPISIVCTQRMKDVQDRLSLFAHSSWFSDYAERPSKLFEGAEVLLTIILARGAGHNEGKQFTTGFTKWAAEERPSLFQRVSYCETSEKPKPHVIPKLSTDTEVYIMSKMNASGGILARHLHRWTPHRVYYRIGGGRYWKIFTNFRPHFVLNGEQGISSRENYLFLPSEIFRDATISVLSSSLFYWYFILTTNCRDLNPSDLNDFPLNLDSVSNYNLTSLCHLCEDLMKDYKNNCQLKEKTSSLTGNIQYQEFYPRLSKHIIDEIDQVLAKHYGFSDEELDYIINYDIKYRMGLGKGGADEEEEE